MITKKYKLPISGTVISLDPLGGDKNDPIGVIPLNEIDGRPTRLNPLTQEQMQEGCAYTCLNYNIEEEWVEVELEASEAYHDWLTDILPQLKNIQKTKNWKLDKSKLR